MNEHKERTLVERVERLEGSVGELRRHLQSTDRGLDGMPELEVGAREDRSAASSPPEPADSRAPRPAAPSFAPTGRGEPQAGPGVGEAMRGLVGRLPFGMEDLRSWEWWLNRVGIGLLLFGIAFLFKFSLDRGWLQVILTEPVRVGLGLATGLALIAIGLRVYEERRAFSQVLLGGGVAALYITGFAAYGLYHLVPYPLAFGFMVAVTLLAFSLSVRQSESALSLVGTLGGLGTPFVLYTGETDVGSLVLYTSLLLAGTAAVYLFKGWRSLLAISFPSGWAVFMATYLGGISSGSSGADDRIALQIGVTFAWLLFWLVPVAREVLRSRDPRRWPVSAPGSTLRESPITRAVARLFEDVGGVLGNALSYAHLLSVFTPLIALTFTWRVWELPGDASGWVCFGGAACYALAAVVLKRLGDASSLSYTQALTALVLSTLGLVLILEGNALLFALAAEGAALHFASRRISGRVLAVKAHLIFLAAAAWLCARLLAGIFEGALQLDASWMAFFDVNTAVDLAVIALAFGASRVAWPRVSERVYTIFGHVVLLGWFTRELLLVPGGTDWAFLAWALYAAGLHLLSRRVPRWGSERLAHLISVAAGLWLFGRLLAGSLSFESPHLAIFNFGCLVNLTAIALAVLASRTHADTRVALSYRITAHVAVLALLWGELWALPSGYAYVTIAWGLYAAGLLVAGLRRDHVQLVRGGMATLFLVVGKLFLVDLASVEAVWRILLFVGFGGAFLVLSYYLQALWRPGAGSESSSSMGGRS